MHFIKITLSVFALAFLLLIPVQIVFACECRAPAGNNRKVSDEFEQSETVITATVLSGPDRQDWFDQQSVKIRVEKTYKGTAKAGDILSFGQAAGKDCLWYFSEKNLGIGYLFYLAKPTKARPYKTTDEIEKSDAEPKYFVSTCGRSAALDQAELDIAYLDKVK